MLTMPIQSQGAVSQQVCLRTHREVRTTSRPPPRSFIFRDRGHNWRQGEWRPLLLTGACLFHSGRSFGTESMWQATVKITYISNFPQWTSVFFIIHLCPPSTPRLVPRTTLTSAGTNKAIPYYYRAGMLERNRKGTWGIISHLGRVALEGNEVLGNATYYQASTLHAFCPHPKV